jgi:flagellar basal body-associated protein FliL
MSQPLKIALIIIAVCGVLFVGLLFLARDTDSNQTDSHQNTTTEVKNGSFNYKGSTFTYQVSNEGRDNVATFKPVLPHNDDALKAAMEEVISSTYGEGAIKDVTPGMANRDGINYISYKTQSRTYLVAPVKQDTGEVSSIRYFSE